MKHTKKLIPALGMLLLSACMLVTSTFAWLSMNTEVKATGMTVTAKGEQVYLQIVNGTTQFDNNAKQDIAKTTQTADTSAQLKPITVAEAFEGKTATKFTSSTVDAGKKAVWATNVTKNDNVSTGTDNYTVKEKTALEGYVYSEVFNIRLNPGAGMTETTMNLKVSNVKLLDTSGDNALKNAVSVFVVLGDKGQLFTQGADGGFSTATGDPSLTADGFKNPTENGYAVTVYVFFDGEHEDCTSANLWEANKPGATNKYSVEVTFTLE